MHLGDAHSPHLRKLVDGLCREFETAVACLGSGPVGQSGVESFPLPGSSAGKMGYLLALPALRRAVRSFKPDLVHAHYASSWGLLASLSVPRSVPLVLSAWGTDLTEFPGKSPLHRRLLVGNLRRADRLLVTSRFLRDTARKLDASLPLVVTPFGVDTDFFRPAVRRNFRPGIRLLLAKALLPYYNHAGLFHLLARCRAEGLDLQLALAGDGPLRKTLIALARKLGIDRHVRFLGPLSLEAVRDELQQSDLVLMPSRVDSYGVFALEAQASGLPVIVSRCGGLAEVVAEGYSGFVLDLDREEAWMDRIRLLVGDRELRERMGRQAREFVCRNFALEPCLERIRRVYRSL